MKLCMGLNYDGDPRAIVERVKGLECAGIDMFWMPEAYSFDAVSILGYLAAHTTRAELATCVLPLYSRTPTLIAMTAAGLDAVSGGRFVLGLGASGPQVVEGWHGVPYDRPLTRSREIIDICRLVWKRDRVIYGGQAYSLPLPPERGTGLGKPLKIINHPVRPDIPIYLAALGPKNVQLVAEVAEGWIPTLFHPDKAVEVWGPDLAAGTARRDSARGPLEVVASASVAICGKDTAAVLRDRLRPRIALYVGGMGAKGQNFYNDLFRRYGYEQEAEAIQEHYLSGRKDQAAALIPDEFLSAASLIGDEGFIRERLQAYKDAGVTRLMIDPLDDEPRELIGKVKEWAQ